MDTPTVKHYTDTADERCAAYEGVDVSGTHELMLRHFGKDSRLLEIGCGSGRDAAFLVSHGRDVTAMDASEGMVKAASKAHPELARSSSAHRSPCLPDTTCCRRPSMASTQLR
jgi:2-polyprenyl-3-methyl-5-hydroxy-6-metoxy-1,4-benzoquinol methylase